jgi:hypothetical protein
MSATEAASEDQAKGKRQKAKGKNRRCLEKRKEKTRIVLNINTTKHKKARPVLMLRQTPLFLFALLPVRISLFC